MKTQLAIIATVLVLAGCNESKDTPTPSESRACLPVSTNSMPGYTPAELAKADFCVPKGEKVGNIVISDMPSWEATVGAGATRVAFSPKVDQPIMASVILQTDKQIFRFVLKPGK